MDFDIIEMSDFTGDMAHIYSVMLRGEEQTLLEQFFEDIGTMNTVNNKTATGTLGHIIRNIDKQSLAKTRNRMMVAARIADGMKARQLNQKQFAKLMGRTESEISDWLSGDRNFTIDTLFDIGQVLGIDFLGTSIHYVYADAEIEEPVFA